MASLKNYMPVAEFDSTSRLTNHSHSLLDPIYVLPTWDLFAERAHTSLSSLADATSFERITRFGRPLWYALYFNGMKEHELVQLAKCKLSCCNAARCIDILKESLPKIKTKGIGKNFALAMIGCRVNLFLNPNMQEANELVAHHMAINYSVSSDRSKLIAGYGSEPIMCEAAAQMWNEEPDVFRTAIQMVAECVTSGVVSQGDLGELAARAIVLKAVDYASDYERSAQQQTATASRGETFNNNLHYLNYTSPIRVESFLRSFGDYENEHKKYRTDQGYKKEFDKVGLDKLLNCYILVNHFIDGTQKLDEANSNDLKNLGKIKTGNYPSLKKIKKFASRYGATICKTNQRCIDLIIPVFDDQMNQVSWILIQVKCNSVGTTASNYFYINPVSFNYEKLSEKDDITNKLPFIAIWIELGQVEENHALNCVEWDSSDQFISVHKNHVKRIENNHELNELKNLKKITSIPKEIKTIDARIDKLETEINYYDNQLENKDYFRNYIQKKQVFIFIRGINKKNYLFLKNDNDVNALKKLAFAKHEATNIIEKPQDKIFYHHIQLCYGL